MVFGSGSYMSLSSYIQLFTVNTHMQAYMLPFLVDANSFLLGLAFGIGFAVVFALLIWIVLKL